MADRDRDAWGRPQSARPRDRLGRPLPPGAPDDRTLLPPVPADPGGVLALARQLLEAGRPFEAHEVLEEQWKRTAGPERLLWRGLAQLAVAHTHHLRGNRAGADALARRARETLAAAPPTELVDVTALIAYAIRLEGAASFPPLEPPGLL